MESDPIGEGAIVLPAQHTLGGTRTFDHTGNTAPKEGICTSIYLFKETAYCFQYIMLLYYHLIN